MPFRVILLISNKPCAIPTACISITLASTSISTAQTHARLVTRAPLHTMNGDFDLAIACGGKVLYTHKSVVFRASSKLRDLCSNGVHVSSHR